MVYQEQLALVVPDVVPEPQSFLDHLLRGPDGQRDVSAQVHVHYLDAPVQRVLSIIPDKYDDIWTAAKGSYKLEPVVADGGEVILYAPHVKQISATHPEIDQIGYHCRDFFVKQWDRYKHLHWGVLAHSTHLRGAGTYDEADGERLRVTVTLATAIPESVVRGANLNYLHPDEVDIAAFEADPNTLVVPQAGEILYRLREQGPYEASGREQPV